MPPKAKSPAKPAKKSSKSPDEDDARSLRSTPAKNLASALDAAASPKPKAGAKRGKKSNATFVDACDTAKITLPTAKAAIAKLLESSLCDVVDAELLPEMRERIGALLWTLQYHKDAALLGELSDFHYQNRWRWPPLFHYNGRFRYSRAP